MTTRSRTERVDASYRSLRVPLRTRLRLLWYARSDRRAGLPVGLDVRATPVLQELVAQFGDVCERERTAYLADVRDVEVRLGQLDADIAALRAMLRRQTEEADRRAAGPGEEWLAVRYPGEEQLTTVATRERRAVTARHVYEAARADQHATESELDARLAEQADLQTQKRAQANVLRSRVVRFHQLTNHKAAIYRRALIRRHPQRDQLIQQWTTDLCDLPAWAAAEMPLPAPEPTGASA